MPPRTIAVQKIQSEISAERCSAAFQFDELPGSAYVRQPVVQALFACSASTVWRLVRSGVLPAPRKLGPRVTVWRVHDLRQAMESLG